jgi:hypothetical protein
LRELGRQPEMRRADHRHGARHPPAKLKRLGRHKSFDVLGGYLELGDLFGGHPLSDVL